MPCNLFTDPDGSFTDKPLHFSVKNIVPFDVKAISHGSSSLSIATSVERVGVAANNALDAIKPMDTSEVLSKLFIFNF
jgi:hypothetical protein